MILNLSAGDNTSEEVEVLLTELETEINTLMTELKSDVESMMTKLNNDVSSAVATLSTRGAVKSVQRGVAKTNGSGLTININTALFFVTLIPAPMRNFPKRARVFDKLKYILFPPLFIFLLNFLLCILKL